MTSQKFTISIRNGRMQFIYNDLHLGLMDEGKATTTRASHVEPSPDGGWTADMGPVGGPVLGPFRSRGEALDEEVKFLEQKLF